MSIGGEMNCHDCDCYEGEFHEEGCDMERCPECGGQLISCGHEGIVNDKFRIPFIDWPTICARCGEIYPVGRMVPDEEWAKYIEPAQRNKVVCNGCYNRIVEIIDYGERERNGSIKED